MLRTATAPPALRAGSPVSQSRLAPPSPLRGARIIKEKVAASSDTDESTAQTVAKMCEYIHKSSGDPIVQQWARAACDRLALGNTSPESLCWGVWWMAKHRVRFAKDEPRLMGTGDGDALDLLIEPAVLVRQAQPAEDCDGFTMLICAMLEALGVPWNIVTIACDPSDPARWSHVFPVAVLGKTDADLMPLDASHGEYPGWMVPAAHTTRWQCWDERARKVNRHVRRPEGVRNTLHGYTPARRRRPRAGMSGLGQTICSATDEDGNCIAYQDLSDLPTFTPAPVSPAFEPGVVTPAPSSSSAINWANLFAGITGQAARVTTVAELQPGQTMLPNGAVVAGNPYAFSGASLSSYMPLLLIAGVGLLVLSSAGGRR